MIQTMVANGVSGGSLAEVLWERYRMLADMEMSRNPIPAEGQTAVEARGAMYLFVVNLIARWVDRVEQEPDPGERARLIEALLAAGRSGGMRRA